MPETRAIIFDFDGTLANTGEAYDAIHIEICKRLGLQYPTKLDEHFMKHLHTMNPKKTEDFWGKFVDESTEPMKQLIKAQKVEAAEGMLETLRKMQQQGLRMAITTNSHSQTVKEFVHSFGITQYITAISARDDVAHPKPAPDLYLHCMQSLKERPENVAAAEDSILGVQAAQAAGIQKILLSTEFAEAKDISDETVLTIGKLKHIMLHF